MDKQALVDVGLALQRGRKASKLTLAQVSKELKIKKDYLAGIEKGDVHLIPFEAYVLGYIKHYSILLGLDPQEFIDKIKTHDKTIVTHASKNIITAKEFLPSAKIVVLSLAAMCSIYLILAVSS